MMAPNRARGGLKTRPVVAHRRLCAGLILTAAALALLPMPVSAQEAYPEPPGISLELRPWLDGWYDAGQWVALDARLRNSGEPIEVELRTRSGSAAEWFTRVTLPQGADERVPLLLRPDAPLAQVEVLGPDGRVVATPTRQVDLRQTRPGEYLVALMGEDVGRLPGLDSGLSRSFQTTVDALPENSLGLGSLDAMVLDTPDLGRATEAQLEALRQWMGLGGTLVILGTPNLTATLAALPAALRPASVSGTVWVPELGPGLAAALARAERPGEQDLDWTGGATLVALRPAPAAEVVARAGELPLMLRQEYGNGQVWLLAFDPDEPPVSRWGNMERLWDALRPSQPRVWDEAPSVLDSLAAGLYEERGSRLPSAGWALLLLGAYVFFVGPLNYLVLKQRRRLDLAWLTIPAITVLATLGTYAVGLRLHGRDLWVHQVSTVRVVPAAGLARVTTLVALFSPAARSYDLGLPGATAYALDSPGLRPGAPLRVRIGPEGGVEDLVAKQWATVGYAADAVIPWPVDDGGPPPLSPDASTARLANPFGRPVAGAQALVPGSAYWLGDLEPGATTQVPLTSQAGRSMVSVVGPEFEATAQHRALLAGTLGRRNIESYYHDNWWDPKAITQPVELEPVRDLVLFGFDDLSPIPVRVEGLSGKRREVAMYVARWPLPGAEARVRQATVVLRPATVLPRSPACDSQSGQIDVQTAGNTLRFLFDRGSLDLLDWNALVWADVTFSAESTQALEAAGLDPRTILDRLYVDAIVFTVPGFSVGPLGGSMDLGWPDGGRVFGADLQKTISGLIREGADLRLEIVVDDRASPLATVLPDLGSAYCLTVELKFQAPAEAVP